MASGTFYAVCQGACSAVWVTCYTASGLVAGTVTAGVGAPAAALACNAACGACASACAAKFGVEVAAEVAAGPLGWASAGISITAVGAVGAIYLGKQIADVGFDAVGSIVDKVADAARVVADKGTSRLKGTSAGIARSAMSKFADGLD
eukprot:CAMPEP_0203961696 /NCGR_PEP_ID=MMETSP0359-20131031/92076_1 /ASSEMBLY_ACC=CAM_ASM_000338 /TAXON_ID=268821 /ORGANISM="Scrippsiella Hangoei, Strain SHTV-5" /LENGTH=147 /DNA_ID=CAMNT_0050896651 /DNA_START=89 /DNA_END=529 /DNA_ORIENTATION=+